MAVGFPGGNISLWNIWNCILSSAHEQQKKVTAEERRAGSFSLLFKKKWSCTRMWLTGYYRSSLPLRISFFHYGKLPLTRHKTCQNCNFKRGEQESVIPDAGSTVPLKQTDIIFFALSYHIFVKTLNFEDCSLSFRKEVHMCYHLTTI